LIAGLSERKLVVVNLSETTVVHAVTGRRLLDRRRIVGARTRPIGTGIAEFNIVGDNLGDVALGTVLRFACPLEIWTLYQSPLLPIT